MKAIFKILIATLPLFAAAAEKPNIVLLVADDLNPYYLGYAGDPDVKTPHLDALAKESTNFTRCYTASPVCMPARTSLVTGLYPHSTGCWGKRERAFRFPRAHEPVPRHFRCRVCNDSSREVALVFRARLHTRVLESP